MRIGVHTSFVESVPFKCIAIFTLFQFVHRPVCFGVTWIPIAGILVFFFLVNWNIVSLPFFLLISIRQRLLPKFFHPQHLRELDAAEHKEIAGARTQSLVGLPSLWADPILCVWC